VLLIVVVGLQFDQPFQGPVIRDILPWPSTMYTSHGSSLCLSCVRLWLVVGIGAFFHHDFKGADKGLTAKTAQEVEFATIQHHTSLESPKVPVLHVDDL